MRSNVAVADLKKIENAKNIKKNQIVECCEIEITYIDVLHKIERANDQQI
jgi:hypothetical protein